MSVPDSSSHVTPGRKQIAREYLALSRHEIKGLAEQQVDAHVRRDRLIVLAWEYDLSAQEISDAVGLTVAEVAETVSLNEVE